MKFLLAALIVAAAVLVLGCVQVSPPESCTNLSATDQPGCVYYTAVMNQDPYACYALSDPAQRTVCLKDAIDPAAKKAIAKKKLVVSSGAGNGSLGLKVPSGEPASLPHSFGNSSENTAPAQEQGNSTGGLRTLGTVTTPQ